MLCLVLFLAATPWVHAGGQAEPRLADAEKLFQQQDYAGALKMLAAIQRNDPNLRDAAGELLGKIMSVTQHYNTVLEELNKAVVAGDVAQMEALIPQLHQIDPVRAASVTGQAQVLVGFLKLMIRAQALLRDGKTVEALNLYLLALTDPVKSGVALPLNLFDAAGYGEIITTRVKKISSDLVATTRQEVAVASNLPAVLPVAKSLLARGGAPSSGATVSIASQLDTVTAPLLQAAAAEGTIRGGAAALADINRSIELSAGSGREDLLLRYLSWISLGRETEQEGIAYAIRLLWASNGQAVADAASAEAKTAFESAVSRFDAGSLAAADAQFQEIPARSLLAAKSAALVSARYGVDQGEDSRALADVLVRTLSAQEYSAESLGYRLLIADKQELGGMPAAAATAGDTAADIARLVSARATLGVRAAAARDQQSQWTAAGTSWRSKAGVLAGVAALADSANHLASLFQNLTENDVQSLDRAYALRSAAFGGATFPTRLDSAVAMRARSEDLKDGTVNGQVPPGTGLTVKRPDQALQILAAAGGNLDTLIADILSQEQKLQGEKPYVKASAGFAGLFDGTGGKPGYNGLLQTAQSEKGRIDALAATAQRQVDNAALASREGDNSFSQAQAALARRDPEGALSLLDQATRSYLKSLAEAFTDHASARTTTDADDLNRRIGDLQTTLAVANAQKAVGAINKLIAADNFLGASDALDSAVRAWSVSQEASYPPFDNLRQTIQAAVELSQGREINNYDPKADVVNAFIKNAQDNLAAGRLAEATQNVRDALAVAPNFGTAKVLQLQIKKQTDPAAFQREAAAQIATYMKMGADKGNAEGLRTAYYALVDYAKLDPLFAAQTRGAIQELKYTLGIAVRPPSAQQIAQSNALVQRANAAQQLGTPESYQQALDLLRQALAANPGNPDVLRLDGLIRTKMGSTALTALSGGDAQVYQRAYSLFLSGAYQDAYDNVMSLWNSAQSPRNKSYGPLQRLKKRLEVQLNIS